MVMLHIPEQNFSLWRNLYKNISLGLWFATAAAITLAQNICYSLAVSYFS